MISLFLMAMTNSTFLKLPQVCVNIKPKSMSCLYLRGIWVDIMFWGQVQGLKFDDGFDSLVLAKDKIKNFMPQKNDLGSKNNALQVFDNILIWNIVQFEKCGHTNSFLLVNGMWNEPKIDWSHHCSSLNSAT